MPSHVATALDARGVTRLTRRDREEVFLRSDGKCHYCGNALERGRNEGGSNPRHFTVNHVVPVSGGGKTTLVNCVASCRRCNTLKGARTVEEWGLDFEPKCFGVSAVVTKSQYARFQELARRQNITQGELIRRWIDVGLAP